ncbi:MAG: hypothetical protein J6X01_03000 [Bacteroidales bacterium]|jgi:hypothetical protein|nr:hypothetical protein [Bacteroidales bacterium]
MDQFDQIIKEKINDKSYDYRPQAWKSFKHSSGMPMLGTGAKLALSAAAVAVVGTVLYFSLSPNPEPQETNVTVCEEQKSENQQMDTTDLAENVVLEEVTEETVASSCSTPAVVTSPAQPKPQAQQTVAEEVPAESNESTQPRRITRTVHYRPSEILVDTISSIDFPDYKAKPADMLP